MINTTNPAVKIRREVIVIGIKFSTITLRADTFIPHISMTNITTRYVLRVFLFNLEAPPEDLIESTTNLYGQYRFSVSLSYIIWIREKIKKGQRPIPVQ